MCLHFHLLLPVLPSGQCLCFSKKIFINCYSLQEKNMPKATPSTSVPAMCIPQPVPLKYKACGKLAYLLDGSLLWAVHLARVLCLQLDGGRAGLCVFPLHRTSSVRCEFWSNWRITERYLTFMQSFAIHRTFSYVSVNNKDNANHLRNMYSKYFVYILSEFYHPAWWALFYTSFTD